MYREAIPVFGRARNVQYLLTSERNARPLEMYALHGYIYDFTVEQFLNRIHETAPIIKYTKS